MGMGMGMGTRTVGTGWGWEQSLWGRGGDGDQVCGDGVEMGKGTTGTVGDGAELLSPCSSLVQIRVLHISLVV